jgi:hypothetical protein
VRREIGTAAALALLGWYLMSTPPPPPNGLTNPALPLSVWQIVGSFDSAQDCERLRSSVVHDSNQAQELRNRANFLCIATDDPRLKQK